MTKPHQINVPDERVLVLNSRNSVLRNEPESVETVDYQVIHIQNELNPFRENSAIKYYLPDYVIQAGLPSSDESTELVINGERVASKQVVLL